MSNPFLINPFLTFLISFAAFWIASLIGRWFGDRALKLEGLMVMISIFCNLMIG